jgi:mannose-6-phosphate isomerase-like protein (cupin superfamily)
VSWQTVHLGPDYDLLAPDGSEIRLLLATSGASMVHCTLQPGQATIAVQHRTVEEVWFCASGTGELWRRAGEQQETSALKPGTAASIPLGTAFQFRATGSEPLQIIITTIPPWPGEGEAVPVEGTWQPTVGA